MSPPAGRSPRLRKCEGVLQLIRQMTWACLPPSISGPTLTLVLCSVLPRTPTSLLSLHPSLGLPEAEDHLSPLGQRDREVTKGDEIPTIRAHVSYCLQMSINK